MTPAPPGPLATDASHAPLARFLAAQRPRLRVLFACYALALFTVTHWPALEVNVPYVQRPDLFIHFACFGCWFACFWLAAFVGPPLRFRSIAISAVIAVLYAGCDEGLQALPLVRRNCAWDDFFANCGGILLAAIIACSITLLVSRPAARRPV